MGSQQQQQDKTAEKMIATSGFPLQIWVEHLVKTHAEIDWHVAGTERRWSVPKMNDYRDQEPWERGRFQGGYIDLLLSKNQDGSGGNIYLNVECKRSPSEQGPWVFYVPTDTMQQEKLFKLLLERVDYSVLPDGARGLLQRKECKYIVNNIEPTSYVAKFADVPKLGMNRTLDSVASELAHRDKVVARLI